MQLTSIRACVSPDTINRVGRLFNNTLPDVLNELLQNARRAGATEISIKLRRADHVVLTVRDNGIGIANPQTVLTLGQSDWSTEIAAREDPAGMGMFSLAGHDVAITSRHASNPCAWRIDIPGGAWDGSADIPLEEAEHPLGTSIDIILPSQWDDHVDRLVAAAALHYHIPVTLNGETCKRVDWLAGAMHIAEWNGCRIGVFTGRHFNMTALNFHGHQIHCKLPTVNEINSGSEFYAKVDIHDCPALQLVLPARKEAVANSALEDLRLAVERIIFEGVAERPRHCLPFESWKRAADIGVNMPEAAPELHTWQPSIADASCSIGLSKPIPACEAILAEPGEPDVEQCLARALKDTPLRAQLADERSAYEGYSWYDRLPRLDNFRFDIEHGGGTFTVSSANAEPAPTDHLKASSITLRADLVEDGMTSTISHATDLALVTDPSIWDGLEAARIIYTDSLTPDDLIDILDAAYFSPSDDADCDSWETQRRYFESEAREMAIKLLRGADEAICDQFRCLLRDRRWLVPQGVRLELLIDGDTINVALKRVAEEAA